MKQRARAFSSAFVWLAVSTLVAAGGGAGCRRAPQARPAPEVSDATPPVDAPADVGDAYAADAHADAPVPTTDCAPSDPASTAPFADLEKSPSLDGLRYRLRTMGWTSSCWEEGQTWRINWYNMHTKVGTSYRIHCPTKGLSFEYGVSFFGDPHAGPEGKSLAIRTYPPRLADKPLCKSITRDDDTYHGAYASNEYGDEGACVLEPGCFPRACIAAEHLAAARAATPSPATCPKLTVDPSWVATGCVHVGNDLLAVSRGSSFYRPCVPTTAAGPGPAYALERLP